MPVRPDIGDEIEFLDEISVLPADAPDLVDAEVDTAPEPAPSLAEQRARRRHRSGLGRDIRKGVA